MSKEKKVVKTDEDCGGLKLYNPVKPPKKTAVKKPTGAKKTK